MVSYPPKLLRTPRCSACQLQMCKSRDEPPHPALKAMADGISREKFNRREIVYLCQTCGAVMVHSADVAEPGWHQRR